MVFSAVYHVCSRAATQIGILILPDYKVDILDGLL